MEVSLDTQPVAHTILCALVTDAETENETWEQVETKMEAAAREAIQNLQEQWEEEEIALKTADDEGMSDEKLTQMITDIIDILAAAQTWAPRALDQVKSQLHAPEMPPQVWAQLIRKHSSAHMQAVQGVKWRTVTETA